MGVARGAIALLAEEAARRPFAGKLATLGRQRIRASSAEATRQLERFGIVPRRTLSDPLTTWRFLRRSASTPFKATTTAIMKVQPTCWTSTAAWSLTAPSGSMTLSLTAGQSSTFFMSRTRLRRSWT